MIPGEILQEPDRTAEMILVQMGNEYMRDISVPDLPAPDQGGDRLAGIEQIIFPAADDQIRTVGLIPAAVARRGGGLNEERIAARKPVLNRLYELARQWENLFALPDYEPVGLLYSEDSLTLSKKAADAYLRCSESLLRNHIPYRVIASCGDELDEASMTQCSSFILPNANCLSDAVVRKIRKYQGKLYLAGDENGSNDEKYREREALPFEDLSVVKIDIPQHDVSKADWKLAVRFVPDNWKQIFDTEISFELHPAAQPVIKIRDGKVAAVLISAPTSVPASRIKVPTAMQEAGYQLMTLDGTSKVSFHGDTVELPAFEGMLMLISTREKPASGNAVY